MKLRYFIYIIILAAVAVCTVHPVDGLVERIQQGETVYLGECYDIGGVVGWAYTEFHPRLAWYRGYAPEWGGDDPVTVNLPYGIRGNKSLSVFCINESFFYDKVGMWYQYTSEPEMAANLMAFFVSPHPREVVNVTNKTPPVNITPIPTPQVVPEKEIADFLVARGDPFNYTLSRPALFWLFGRTGSAYGYDGGRNGTFSLNVSQVNDLEVGSYKFVIQEPQTNTSPYTVSYNASTREIRAFNIKDFSINVIKAGEMDPLTVYDKIQVFFKNSPDVSRVYTFELQQPMIEVITADVMDWNNVTAMLNVKGYTNVKAGTVLNITVDEDRLTKDTMRERTSTTDVKGVKVGNMRYFQALVPIRWALTPPGQHFITVRSPQGAYQRFPYYVYEIPEGQQVPNATLKYIAGNLWVPTPTPEIVTVIQTQIVTRTVTIPVTPSNEQVKKMTDQSVNESWRFWGSVLFVGALVVIFGYLLLRWVIRARER